MGMVLIAALPAACNDGGSGTEVIPATEIVCSVVVERSPTQEARIPLQSERDRALSVRSMLTTNCSSASPIRLASWTSRASTSPKNDGSSSRFSQDPFPNGSIVGMLEALQEFYDD